MFEQSLEFPTGLSLEQSVCFSSLPFHMFISALVEGDWFVSLLFRGRLRGRRRGFPVLAARSFVRLARKDRTMKNVRRTNALDSVAPMCCSSVDSDGISMSRHFCRTILDRGE